MAGQRAHVRRRCDRVRCPQVVDLPPRGKCRRHGGAVSEPLALEPVVAELIKDRLLESAPDLTDEQWKQISELAERFASEAPNPPAVRVRRKLAVYQMISDATSSL